MNNIPLIITVHATKITKEIRDEFTFNESLIKHVTKSISDEFTFGEHVVIDHDSEGSILDLKYPI